MKQTNKGTGSPDRFCRPPNPMSTRRCSATDVVQKVISTYQPNVKHILSSLDTKLKCVKVTDPAPLMSPSCFPSPNSTPVVYGISRHVSALRSNLLIWQKQRDYYCLLISVTSHQEPIWSPRGGSLSVCGPRLRLSGETFVPRTNVCQLRACVWAVKRVHICYLQTLTSVSSHRDGGELLNLNVILHGEASHRPK